MNSEGNWGEKLEPAYTHFKIQTISKNTKTQKSPAWLLNIRCTYLVYYIIYRYVGHIIAGLIVPPANSNLVPSGLGLRPGRIYIFFRSPLFSCIFLPVYFLFTLLLVLYFGCMYDMYHGYVPGIIWLQVGMVYPSSLVSFPCALALFFFLPWGRFFVACL